MPPSDFASANIAEVVNSLTTEEAISLIAGVGFWHTHAVERLGIPAIKVSDGPNGVRGNHFFMSTPAKCLPCSTALGATWDTQLIEEIGQKLLAPEAKLKAASVILAPTSNIQRNPLGGRSFESFSEDPLLNGLIASAYVRGVQSGGIGTTIKHFVCNDKENDRMAYDSVLSERALREIYLMPFMLAQKYAQPWSYMTAYNRVNGTHASENARLINDILRNEWKFNGLIMSDWFGVYSVDLSINAGLDLEMPGTNKWRSLDLVTRSITSRKVTVRTIKERATKVLEFVQRCAKEAPEILDGSGEEKTVEKEEDTRRMRNLAAQSIVLLKNEGDLLPLKPTGLKKIAIVGGNAKAIVLSGGGSAALKPSFFISPFDGITSGLSGENVEITYSEGASTYKRLPTLDFEMFTESGERGWISSWYSHESDDSMVPLDKPMHVRHVDETRMFISTSSPPGITKRWTLKLHGKLRPRSYDTSFEFGLTTAGRAKLFVDGVLVIDNWTRQVRGDDFFGSATIEEKGVIQVKANVKHDILVEYCNVRGPADGDEEEIVMDTNPGIRLGGTEVQGEEEKMAEAIALAKDADAVIAIVGLNADWETEGYDRTTLALPGRTDELVAKVAAVNPRTIVVTQSGSTITMPWIDSVASAIHVWYLGNATGDAIADVLFGKINPSGKMPLTFPKRLEDVPSHGHFHSENGQVRYGEDLFVGYKHYEHTKTRPLFPFGFGLSYTTFAYSDLQLSEPVVADGDFNLTVQVKITNTGSVIGSEVAQLYITLPDTSDLTHPPLQLKAFSKARDLEPGSSTVVKMALDKYAVSYWSELISSWVVEKGVYHLRVGPSSDNLPLTSAFTIKQPLEWRGL